jgi:hypothetical protein
VISLFFQSLLFTNATCAALRLGRVLEHSFVRNKDVIATYDLTPGQVECDPNGAPMVKLIGDQKATMGKIKSVELEQLVNMVGGLVQVVNSVDP